MWNLSQIMQLKNITDRLRRNHPKFPAFLNAVLKNGIKPDTVIELRVIEPDGQEYITNLRINEEDLQCFAELSELQKSMRK